MSIYIAPNRIIFILLYGWVVLHYTHTHTHTHTHTFTPYLLYPFLCQGTLSCFYVLATVNSAAMNTEAHVSFWIIVFSGLKPWRMALLFLFFKRTSILFSIVAVSLYTPTSGVGRLLWEKKKKNLTECLGSRGKSKGKDKEKKPRRNFYLWVDKTGEPRVGRNSNAAERSSTTS